MEASSGTYIAAVNAGSSSIKLTVFAAGLSDRVFEASVTNIGQPSPQLVTPSGEEPADIADHAEAAALLLRRLEAIGTHAVSAVGHRIVHGGPKYYESCAATPDVLADLRQLAAFDPAHLPVELQLVSLFQERLPHARHILCFDTAIHHDLPNVARLLPIPRRFADAGVRRYGFHGLSYAYILDELRRVEGEAAANGKVIIAHLGSGASLAAFREGKPVDTTMSMTPASGIPMSTRSGDLDPGLALYLQRTAGYDTERFTQMANFESGLLGISGSSADMKKLLEAEASDLHAKDAVDVFCYHAKKQIGALAAALGGLNTLVFTGGIGEAAPKVRTWICDRLEFLGITLDPARNAEGARLISADGALVGVHVIHTDEAITIARETAKLIQGAGHGR